MGCLFSQYTEWGSLPLARGLSPIHTEQSFLYEKVSKCPEQTVRLCLGRPRGETGEMVGGGHAGLWISRKQHKVTRGWAQDGREILKYSWRGVPPSSTLPCSVVVAPVCTCVLTCRGRGWGRCLGGGKSRTRKKKIGGDQYMQSVQGFCLLESHVCWAGCPLRPSELKSPLTAISRPMGHLCNSARKQAHIL